MTEKPEFKWVCEQCGYKLDCLGPTSLEVQKRLHLDMHHRIWIGKNPQDYLPLFKGRYQSDPNDPTSWKDWSDAEFLATDMKIDPIGEDRRTDEELARRYKEKGAKNE